MRSARWRLLAFATCLGVRSVARADEGDDAQRRTSGIERPASDGDDAARAWASGALYVPRETLSLLFLGTSTAAAILQDDANVPRFGNIGHGATRLYVFPTLFAETNSAFSVGARLIGASDATATSLRAGIGGVRDTELEARVLVRPFDGVPLALGLESLFLRSSNNEYAGLGQTPAEDARNRFRAGRVGDAASYDERRERGIVSLGGRPVPDLEVLGTISFDRRTLDDRADPSRAGFDDVFVPGTLPGADAPTRLYYAELALRFDSRTERGGPQTGLVVETYGGFENQLADSPDIALYRVGSSAGVFIPILRRTNILAPRVFLDGVAARDDAPIPFTELPLQPQFRGAGFRRDLVSLVGNLDYRWGFTSNLGARIFVDGAAVGPSVDAIEIARPRVAGGFGLDLWSSGSDLGSVSVAGGPDGVAFHVAFGVSSGFADDRQHRD